MTAAANIYRVRHGALCHLAGDEVIGASLDRYGEWAEEELFLLHKAIQPGAVVLDIGANIGTHSLAFSRFAGPAGQVIAFDGQPRAFQLLSMNMALNRCANVACYNLLAGQQTTVTMIDDMRPARAENLGSMSFQSMAPGADWGRVKYLTPVPMVSIDSLRLLQCDVMKIDVEGMELDVLRGATRTLQRHRPLVYFEQTGEPRLAEIAQLLRGLGYLLYWHIANPYNAENFRRNAENIFGSAKETNILAVHAGRTDLAFALATRTLMPVADHYPDAAQIAAAPGWSLPGDAYAGLALPFAHAARRDSFDEMLPGAAAWGAADPDAAVILHASFRNLLADRQKAQEIMEHLSARVGELERESENLRRAPADTFEPVP